MIRSRKDIAEYICWFENSRQISCMRQIMYDCDNMRAATNSSLTIGAFACVMCDTRNTNAIRFVPYETSIYFARDVNHVYGRIINSLY